MTSALPVADANAAVETIEKVTGQWLLGSVPADKVDVLIAAWRALPVAKVPSREQRKGGTLSHIHSRLDGMAKEIFGPKVSRGNFR